MNERDELMMYALADAEKFWRHKRREAKSGIMVINQL